LRTRERRYWKNFITNKYTKLPKKEKPNVHLNPFRGIWNRTKSWIRIGFEFAFREWWSFVSMQNKSDNENDLNRRTDSANDIARLVTLSKKAISNKDCICKLEKSGYSFFNKLYLEFFQNCFETRISRKVGLSQQIQWFFYLLLSDNVIL